MNYLAHAYLSCSNEDILFGNFIGDSVNSKTDDRYSRSIFSGILLHRKIDTYTDQHKLIKEAVRIFRPEQSKYAPVVTDILWDHVLSKYWSTFSEDSLRDFIDGVYAVISSRKPLMPIKLASKIDKMLDGDFMFRYQSIEGLELSFSYMDRRTKFESRFTDAVDTYLKNERILDQLFLEFFPDLVEFVKKECDCDEVSIPQNGMKL